MRIALVFGTRPEAIKLCPVVQKFRHNPMVQVNVCVTAQHRRMLDQTLTAFDVVPDVDLDLMQPNQTLSSLTSRVLNATNDYYRKFRPDLIMVQGDTTTAFAAGLAAYYERIPVAHVEAGLRTGNKLSPYPEEINRTLLGDLACLHFAPTEIARQNLLREGVNEETIVVTGNTVIDALLFAVEQARHRRPEICGIPASLINDQEQGRIVLITGHRRENFGSGFESICQAILSLANRFPDVTFIYPVHLNPNVREPVQRILRGKPNIFLIEPLDYLPFVRLLDRCFFVLTDSGGVQEEAPSLGKPVLVMRSNTERPEAVAAGTARVVGTVAERIVAEASRLLTDTEAYRNMSCATNPYGDGRASERIVEASIQFLTRKEAVD